MKEPEQIQSLERIYRAELRCFVRYLVDGSSPSSLDSADAQVRGLIETWARDSAANVERIERLFRSENHIAAQGSWSLGFTQFNFLHYSYLPGPVKTRMEALVHFVEGEAKALGDWPGANAAIKELLASHRANLAKLDELVENLPKSESAPASEGKRQTSANFW